MSNSIFLAQVLGPAFLVLAIALGTHRETIREALVELTKPGHKMLVFFAFAVQLIAGLFLVLSHPVWSWNWDVLITILGWALIIRSVLFLWFPESMLGLISKMRKSSWWLYLGIVLVGVYGVVLSYYGYMV